MIQKYFSMDFWETAPNSPIQFFFATNAHPTVCQKAHPPLWAKTRTPPPQAPRQKKIRPNVTNRTVMLFFNHCDVTDLPDLTRVGEHFGISEKSNKEVLFILHLHHSIEGNTHSAVFHKNEQVVIFRIIHHNSYQMHAISNVRLKISITRGNDACTFLQHPPCGKGRVHTDLKCATLRQQHRWEHTQCFVVASAPSNIPDTSILRLVL